MSKVIWSIVFLGFAGLGFYGVSRLLEEEPIKAQRLDYEVLFDRERATPGIAAQGWGKANRAGLPLSQSSGTVSVPFNHSPSGDIYMMVKWRAKAAAGQTSVSVRLHVNNVDIGEWTVEPKEDDTSRLFLIPEAALKASVDYAVNIRVDVPSGAKFVLQSVSFRNSQEVEPYKGSVDHCAPGQISGWASGDNIAVPVKFVLNGQSVEGKLLVQLRPDLKRASAPVDSGFTFVPSQPLPAGSQIHISFANGRKVPGSPCAI